MKRSTAWIKRIIAVVFWLAVWQIAAVAMNQRLLLTSPSETLARFFGLLRTPDFYRSVGFTAANVLGGFSLSLLFAILCAVIADRYAFFDTLLAPLMSALKAIPVASYIIIALLWLPSKRLNLLIVCIVAFPILYAGCRNGLDARDKNNLEMCRVQRLPIVKRLLALDLPDVLPSVRTACGLALGMGWKAAVAAEVLGIVSGSMGERLYESKIYLLTADLFAWTLAIILLSFICEKLVTRLLTALVRLGERSL